MIRFNITTKSLGGGGSGGGGDDRKSVKKLSSPFGDDDDDDDVSVKQRSSLRRLSLNDDEDNGGDDDGKDDNEEEQQHQQQQDEEDEEMQRVMGFGTFGRPPKEVSTTKTSMAKNEVKTATTNKKSSSSTTTTTGKTARKFDLDILMREHHEKVANMPAPILANDSDDDDENDDNDDDDDPVKKSKVTGPTPAKEEEEEESDDDLIGPPLPPGFVIDNDDDDDQQKNKGESKKKKTVTFQNKDVDNDEEEEEDDDDADYEADEDNRYTVLPVSHEIELKHGNKSVHALALDPNGARLVSGSIDYEVKYWDFQGMDSTLQSFRTIKPCQSHSIKHLEYNSNGELILVVSGAYIAKLIDRDGLVKSETIKGDQYIADKSKTKGHVAMLNSGCWHPMERTLFGTTSNDTTCRLWDTTTMSKEHRAVIKPRSATGGFTVPNSIAFTPIGDLLALGCNDGSVQMWDTRRMSFVNTTHVIRAAHSDAETISSIRFSYSGNYLLTRGTGDGLMRLWDVRQLKQCRTTAARVAYQPIHSWTSLVNHYTGTDCFFSPDDRLAVTGVGCNERSGSTESGRLCFFNCATPPYEVVQELECAQRSSVIRSLWHPKLNQLVTSCSNGSIRIWYDLHRSARGALLCSFRTKRKRKDVFQLSTPQIFTPHALPMFKEERRKSHYVQMLKDRKDPIKSRQPELPVTGAGAGGRLASAGKTFASFIAKNLGVRQKIDESEDPREALLKFAKDAEENPYWVTPAYTQTQPKAIFADQTAAAAASAAGASSASAGGTSSGTSGGDHQQGDEEVDEDGQRKRRKHIPV